MIQNVYPCNVYCSANLDIKSMPWLNPHYAPPLKIAISGVALHLSAHPGNDCHAAGNKLKSSQLAPEGHY